MLGFLSFSFWLYFFYFILAIFLAFYIPGNVLIKRLSLSVFPTTVLSFLAGMTLWGWQGFVFGYIGIRWMSYPYLLFFFILWFHANHKSITSIRKWKVLFKKKSIDYILVFLVFFGVMLQLSSVWFTGIFTSKGLSFCCGNVPDNLLQLAITNQVVKNFPPLEPGMFSSVIQNYHYWDSLVMGELIRVFRLPLIATDFQYMTVFISLFLGFSAITFSYLLGLGKIFARWIVFFLYFGGDFVWLLVGILRGRDLFAMHPLESGQQFLENIPRAIAVIVFFAFVSIFLLWIRKKDRLSGFLMAIFAATLIGFKIYIGLFVFFGLGALGLFDLFKRYYSMIVALILAALLGLLIYLPVNSQAGGLYFVGTWRFENFILQGYFGSLPKLELSRAVYIAHHSFLRVISYELFYATFFIVAIFGTKLLGLIQNKKSMRLIPKELHTVLITGIIISAIIGMFFNQTVGGSNTFNFIVSVFIIGSIYTALACYYWLSGKKSLLRTVIIIAIVSLTAIRGFNQAYNNLSSIIRGSAFTIYPKELNAIKLLDLEKDTSKLVIVDPAISMDFQAPYLSFLTDKKMFLSGQVDELDAHGINYSQRLKVRNTIFSGTDPAAVGTALLNNNIGYVYMLSKDSLSSTDTAEFTNVLINNGTIRILKVNFSGIKQYLKQKDNEKDI